MFILMSSHEEYKKGLSALLAGGKDKYTLPLFYLLERGENNCCHGKKEQNLAV